MEWGTSFQGGEFGSSRCLVILAAVEIPHRIPLWIIQHKEPTKYRRGGWKGENLWETNRRNHPMFHQSRGGSWWILGKSPADLLMQMTDYPARFDNLFVQTCPVNPRNFSASGEREHLNREEKMEFVSLQRTVENNPFFCFRNKVVLNAAGFQPISTLPWESWFPVALCISPCAKVCLAVQFHREFPLSHCSLEKNKPFLQIQNILWWRICRLSAMRSSCGSWECLA